MSASKSQAELAKALSETLDQDMWDRLRLHAFDKIRRRLWNGIPGGPDPNDVVEEAVKRVLDPDPSSRNWDPELHPDLLSYLKGVIDSLISAAARSRLNRYEKEFPLASEGKPKWEPPSMESDQLDLVIEREESELSDQWLMGFLDFLRADPDLQKVVECIIDGDSKPRKIAKRLEMKTDAVYSARKRLQRRFEEYRKTLVEKAQTN